MINLYLPNECASETGQCGLRRTPGEEEPGHGREVAATTTVPRPERLQPRVERRVWHVHDRAVAPLGPFPVVPDQEAAGDIPAEPHRDHRCGPVRPHGVRGPRERSLGAAGHAHRSPSPTHGRASVPCTHAGKRRSYVIGSPQCSHRIGPSRSPGSTTRTSQTLITRRRPTTLTIGHFAHREQLSSQTCDCCPPASWRKSWASPVAPC